MCCPPLSLFSPDTPALPPGGGHGDGGLAHQSYASLIVAPMWVGASERMIGKRGGWEQRDARVSCLTKARANDSSAAAPGESQKLSCVPT